MGKKVKKTANIEFCLQKLRAALENPTDENLKKDALDAHEYLLNSFAGVRQPAAGKECPEPIRIMPRIEG